ncbi:MAG TPA: hypothetical protein DEF51_04510 [Myxococcales bacterium]|nr:hypothetical protein [Myxococcales bacterium]
MRRAAPGATLARRMVHSERRGRRARVHLYTLAVRPRRALGGNMKKLVPILFVSAFALALAGCSEPEPVDETVTGELTDSDPRVEQDDSPYDEYRFDVAEGWTITGDMQSANFDTYLWLIDPEGESLVQDDDGGEGTNSRVTYTAAQSGTYTFRANSYNGEGRGQYTLHFTANPGQ